jgi:hypothetical protein
LTSDVVNRPKSAYLHKTSIISRRSRRLQLRNDHLIGMQVVA